MGKTKSGAVYKFEVGKGLVNLIKKNSIEPINILGVDVAARYALKSAHIKAKVVESLKKPTAQYGIKLGMGDDVKGDYSQTKPEAEIISDEIKKFLTGLAMSSSANEIEIASKSGFTQVAGREVIRTFVLDVNKDNSKILKGLIDVFKSKKESEFGWGKIIVKNDRIVLSVDRAKMAKPSTLKTLFTQKTKWESAGKKVSDTEASDQQVPELTK